MDLVLLTCDTNDVTIMRADSYASQKKVYISGVWRRGRNVQNEIPESISSEPHTMTLKKAIFLQQLIFNYKNLKENIFSSKTLGNDLDYKYLFLSSNIL